MKKKITNIFMVLLLAAGVLLLAYPYASFLLAKQNQSYVIQEYDDSLMKLTAEQLQKEWERAAAYNAVLAPGNLSDPFTQGQESNGEYLSLLNVDKNGMMAHIKIPKIDVHLPVYHGTDTKTLEKGVGHLKGSALPVGGAGTHCVLTGHTGLDTAKLFTDLTELEEGDEFYLYTLDQVLAYRVDQIKVVEPSQVEDLAPVEGKDYVTLLTCTPYGINSHRRLVRGERTAYTPEEIEERIEKTKTIVSKETYLLYGGIALLVILFLLFLIFCRHKKKKTPGKERGRI